MKFHLVGFSSLDFTGRDGNQVTGTTLYVNYPDPRVNGLKTDKFFIREAVKLPDSLSANSTLDIEFDPKGRILSVSLLKA